MAQWNIQTQDYLNQERSLFEVVGVASSDGQIISETNRFPVSIGGTEVSIGNSVTVNQGTSPWVVTPSGGSTQIAFPDTSVTAFDEPLAVSITPVMQADAVYGFDPDFWDTTEINGGTVGVTTDTGIWAVGCTTATNSYARLFTSRYARYQPGQGMLFRWTAAFTSSSGTGRTTATGIDGIPQVAGPIDREDGYTFGFSGIATARQFGIQHRRAGKVEVRQLTITTAATGTQTATVTLNGVAYTIPLTAAPGGSTGYTASQIAVGLKTTTAAQYWQIDACSSIVTVAYFSPGAINGTFSFSSSGAGTLAAGSFNRLVTGASPVDEWIYQDQWDNKTIQFDPTKLNVYSVDFRWLGAGIVRFFMEDPDTGKMALVHTQRWTKNQTGIYPHINKPSLRIAYRVGSFAGGTASIPVTIRGASIFAGVQGIINQTGSSQGWYNLDSTARTKDTNWHLLTVQNPYVRNNTVNKGQMVIQNLTVAAQSTDPSVIFLVKNAVGTSDFLVFNAIPGHGNPNVFAQYSVSAVTENLALDNVTNVQTLGINGSSTFDLIPYNFILAPGESMSVFIRSTNAITNSAVGITWKVD
jgi:hypothetical protein